MDQKEALCRQLLLEKFNETGRIPTRADFDGPTVCLIKQKLGPWPRALEAVGLKESKAVSRKQKTILKRERAKARRKEAKRNEAMESNHGSSAGVRDDVDTCADTGICE